MNSSARNVLLAGAGILAVSGVIVGLVVLSLREPAPVVADEKAGEKMTKTDSGLQYLDTKVGTGKEAKKGDKVVVHYTGTFPDGKQFDSSVGKKPFAFTLGAREVIKGWDEGVAGMKEGGKRKLVIPYQLAYGEDGRPPVIPPKSILHFEVELLEVK